MGTDLLFASPVSYEDAIADLPEGVRIAAQFIPNTRGAFAVTGDYKPLRRYPIAHALLMDKCGNSLWVSAATQHDVDYKIARNVGEAAFDFFGMQGSFVHFGHAFEAQGRILFEAMYVKHQSFDPEEDFGTWEDVGLLRRDAGEREGVDRCYRCEKEG